MPGFQELCELKLGTSFYAGRVKILLIGATGFIGTPLVRQLVQGGHEVTIFSRTVREADRGMSDGVGHGVRHIGGDRNHLANYTDEFRRSKPDIVIDMILSNGRQAEALMGVFRGVTGRVVALSSGDVYRACGVLHGFDPGPVQEMPLREDSELRSDLNVYSSEALERVRRVFSWVGDEYDKIPAERAVMSDSEIAGTVLRLPMVYGPGDPLHRLFPYVKRMDDARPAILLQEDAAEWRGPHGYVENVAAAIALAAVSEKAAGRIYNVAEQEAISETEWVKRIGRAAGWNGSIVPIAKESTPAHLRVPYRNEQHWYMSSERIREELGFVEPVSQETALERTIAWERNNPPEWSVAQFDYAAEDTVLGEVRVPRAQ